jgi:ElaB/YqjD/DUF883 family membrane-anchored ribosome-binding protein
MDSKPSEIVNNVLPDRGTVDRAAQTAHEAIDKMAGKAGPAVDRVRAAATGAAESLEAKASALGEMEERWMANTRAYIRENPLTALAIGVLAGAVLAKLSSR